MTTRKKLPTHKRIGIGLAALGFVLGAAFLISTSLPGVVLAAGFVCVVLGVSLYAPTDFLLELILNVFSSWPWGS